MPTVGASSAPHFRCADCGHLDTRFYPQCVSCLKMGTMRAVVTSPIRGTVVALPIAMPDQAPIAYPRQPIPIMKPVLTPAPTAQRTPLVPLPLSAARLGASIAPRVATGIAELDRVLGGGLVDGSVVLMGGDPGSGKSTLLLQAVYALCQGPLDNGALYASAEENEQQIALRAVRMNIEDDRIRVVNSDDVDSVIELASKVAPTALVADSIQTMRTTDLDSEAGSLAQVAECTARLARFAKTAKTPVFIVGQVTKDGAIAGPKKLEHLVDVVLYLETAGGARRHLSAPTKNRFSSTGDVGVFEMREAGLVSVEDASSLTERAAGAPGSAVFPAVVGERVQLVEVQALVGPAKDDDRGRGSLAASGVDPRRVQMILAILAKHADVQVTDRDVYVSVTAGARVTDPAADLAIALAVASSYRDLPIDPSCACYGELGFAGEVRSVARAHARAEEARRGGFSMVLVPHADASEAAGAVGADVRTIADAIALVIGEVVS